MVTSSDIFIGFPVSSGGDEPVRLVLVFLLALGKDLVCSPVSLTYRAGDAVAGCGFPGALLHRSGDGGATFISSGLSHLLVSAPRSSPSIRSPILFQRFRSVLMDLGWWLLRLNHAMESDDGGFRGFSFDSFPAGDGLRLLLLTGAPEWIRTMNRSSRDSFVIFFSFGGLVVKGDVLFHVLIYLPFRKKKKSSTAAYCLW